MFLMWYTCEQGSYLHAGICKSIHAVQCAAFMQINYYYANQLLLCKTIINMQINYYYANQLLLCKSIIIMQINPCSAVYASIFSSSPPPLPCPGAVIHARAEAPAAPAAEGAPPAAPDASSALGAANVMLGRLVGGACQIDAADIAAGGGVG